MGHALGWALQARPGPCCLLLWVVGDGAGDLAKSTGSGAALPGLNPSSAPSPAGRDQVSPRLCPHPYEETMVTELTVAPGR